MIKAFVQEVILDNDNVTIPYNFTENYTKYRVTQEIIQNVQRQSRKKTAYNKNLCSYKLPPFPLFFPTRLACGFFIYGLYSPANVYSIFALDILYKF